MGLSTSHDSSDDSNTVWNTVGSFFGVLSFFGLLICFFMCMYFLFELPTIDWAIYTTPTDFVWVTFYHGSPLRTVGWTYYVLSIVLALGVLNLAIEGKNPLAIIPFIAFVWAFYNNLSWYILLHNLPYPLYLDQFIAMSSSIHIGILSFAIAFVALAGVLLFSKRTGLYNRKLIPHTIVILSIALLTIIILILESFEYTLPRFFFLIGINSLIVMSSYFTMWNQDTSGP